MDMWCTTGKTHFFPREKCKAVPRSNSGSQRLHGPLHSRCTPRSWLSCSQPVVAAPGAWAVWSDMGFLSMLRKLKQKRFQNSKVEWFRYTAPLHYQLFQVIPMSPTISMEFCAVYRIFSSSKQGLKKWPVQDKLNHLSNYFWKAKLLLWHFKALSPAVPWHTSSVLVYLGLLGYILTTN